MSNRAVNYGITAAWLLSAILLAFDATAEYAQCDRSVSYPSVSADGRIIAFESCCSNWSGAGNVLGKVFVYNRERHKVLDICKNGPYFANSDCSYPVISADGRQVVYESGSDNLIGGIGTNAFYVTNNTCNIFACEIEDGDFSSPAPGFTHKLVSVSADGAQVNAVCYYPVCSSNGRFVAFQTQATNLDPDSVDTNCVADNWIYTGWDIYLRDRDLDGNGVFDETGAGKTKTTRVSHDSDSGLEHCARYARISADGQYVSYEMQRSTAPLGRAIGVCVYKVADGSVTVYRPLDETGEARISPDGAYLTAYGNNLTWWYARNIMFALPATNWWYYACPMNTNVGLGVYGTELSTGAQCVAFCSGNTNLVANDTNAKDDIFVRVSNPVDPQTAQYTELVSKSTAGALGNADSGSYDENDRIIGLSWDGRYVVFVSEASNLVAVDTNNLQDIFIRDRLSNTTDIVAQKVGDPSFPSGAALSVSQVGDTSASFQWTAATDTYGIWEYQLTLASSGGSTQITVNGESTTFSATGLEPGTAYTATLEAYDGGGRHSDPLSASFTTTGTAPFGLHITANAQDGELHLDSGDAVTIAIRMLNTAPYAGTAVDWWIVAFAHSGQWYYLNSALQWTYFDGNLALCQPVSMGYLFDLSSVNVLTGYILPVGTYDFWFAIDYPMDGVLDLNGQLRFDKVTVYVQ